MEEIYLAKEIGKLFSLQKRTSTNNYAEHVRAACSEDSTTTSRYNTLIGGKRAGIPTSLHIGYQSSGPPSSNSLPSLYYVSDSDVPESGILGVAVQGTHVSVGVGEAQAALPIDNYMPPSVKRYIDVFTRSNGTFS
jgi:small ligand-binding sensory domain FIST